MMAKYTCIECNSSWHGSDAPYSHVFYNGGIVRVGYESWFDKVLEANEMGLRGRDVQKVGGEWRILRNGLPYTDMREVYHDEIENTPLPDWAGTPVDSNPELDALLD